MTILTFLCLYFYRATTEDVDYLENQCSDVGSLGMCEYQEYPGQDLGFPDLQITARNKGEVTSHAAKYCINITHATSL